MTSQEDQLEHPWRLSFLSTGSLLPCRPVWHALTCSLDWHTHTHTQKPVKGCKIQSRMVLPNWTRYMDALRWCCEYHYFSQDMLSSLQFHVCLPSFQRGELHIKVPFAWGSVPEWIKVLYKKKLRVANKCSWFLIFNYLQHAYVLFFLFNCSNCFWYI